MKALMIIAVCFGMTSSTVALGKEPPKQKGAEVLIKALDEAVLKQQNPPGQAARPDDPDMGDDNAALRALTVVCTKDTPAAQRSAICDRPPVSPD